MPEVVLRTRASPIVRDDVASFAPRVDPSEILVGTHTAASDSVVFEGAGRAGCLSSCTLRIDAAIVTSHRIFEAVRLV